MPHKLTPLEKKALTYVEKNEPVDERRLVRVLGYNGGSIVDRLAEKDYIQPTAGSDPEARHVTATVYYLTDKGRIALYPHFPDNYKKP